MDRNASFAYSSTNFPAIFQFSRREIIRVDESVDPAVSQTVVFTVFLKIPERDFLRVVSRYPLRKELLKISYIFLRFNRYILNIKPNDIPCQADLSTYRSIHFLSLHYITRMRTTRCSITISPVLLAKYGFNDRTMYHTRSLPSPSTPLPAKTIRFGEMVRGMTNCTSR